MFHLVELQNTQFLERGQRDDHRGEDEAVVAEELEFIFVAEPLKEFDGSDTDHSGNDDTHEAGTDVEGQSAAFEGVFDFKDSRCQNSRTTARMAPN